MRKFFLAILVLVFLMSAVNSSRAQDNVDPTNGADPGFTNLIERAKQGDSGAETALGLAYIYGYKGLLPHNNTLGLIWVVKAAEEANAKALETLSDIASRIYHKPSSQGIPVAEVVIAMSYMGGPPNNPEVTKDLGESFKWTQRAAEWGYADGEHLLGYFYASGDGLPKADLVQAYKWTKLAADQGVPQSSQALEAVKSHMTPEQIAEGEALAHSFVPRQ